MLYKLEGLAHQRGFVTLVSEWISLVLDRFKWEFYPMVGHGAQSKKSEWAHPMVT